MAGHRFNAVSSGQVKTKCPASGGVIKPAVEFCITVPDIGMRMPEAIKIATGKDHMGWCNTTNKRCHGRCLAAMMGRRHDISLQGVYGVFSSANSASFSISPVSSAL